jgi:hypothetical protein
MDVIQAYRDDGPLAELLGPVVARLPVAPLPAITAGAAALVVGVALDGTTTGWPTVLGVAGFVVALTGGLVRPPRRRLQWVVSPLLRAGEYGLLVILGWRAGGAGAVVAFGLQCALAFHHYDTVYRLRQGIAGAPAALQRLGLGWDGRMLLVLGASLLGVFAPVAVVLAVWCALLFVTDSVGQWLRAASAVAVEQDAAEDDED